MEAVTESFTPSRLEFARSRAGISRAHLAEVVGIGPRSLANYEGGSFTPGADVVDRLASALDVPAGFFFGEPLDQIETPAVSFRALSKMSAIRRKSALASGAVAVELSKWLDDRLHLPAPDVPKYARGWEDPATAALRLRNEWNMGFAKVRNTVHTLEAHGVRVYSLPKDLTDVDAFSFWWKDVPYVLLNCRKSAERGRFDAIHELGHLVMHGDYDLPQGRERELEANRFAAAFLMPEDDVRAHGLRNANASQVIQAKVRWGVAAMALTHRLHELGLTSDWTYTSTCKQLSQLGYRSGEPDAGAGSRETSQVLEKAFALLRDRGMRQADVARELRVHTSTLREHLFGLVMTPVSGDGVQTGPSSRKLQLVRGT